MLVNFLCILILLNSYNAIWLWFPPRTFILFSFFKHIYWSIIALQWCVSFCFITKWISYTYTYIPISPPSWVSFPRSLSHHSRWSQSTQLISLCYVAVPLAIYFMFGSVYMSMPLSHFVPAYPSHSLCPQIHSLHLRLYSCPAPRFFRTIFFYIFIEYNCFTMVC